MNNNLLQFFIYNSKGQKQSISLSSGQWLIGRDRDNAICLNERNVSKKHALLEVLEHEVWVQDLNSRYGTFVDNEKIDERPRLLGRDVCLKIGDFTCYLNEQHGDFQGVTDPFIFPPHTTSSDEQKLLSSNAIFHSKTPDAEDNRLQHKIATTNRVTRKLQRFEGAETSPFKLLRHQLLFMATTILGIFFCGVGIKLLASQPVLGEYKKISQLSKAIHIPIHHQLEEDAPLLFQKIGQALAQHEWRYAQGLAKILLKSSKHKAEAQQFILQADKEILVAQAIDTATSFMDKQAWDDAWNILKNTATDSCYQPLVKDLLEQTKQHMLQDRLMISIEALKQDNLQAARIALQEVFDLDANSEAYKQIKERIKKYQKNRLNGMADGNSQQP